MGMLDYFFPSQQKAKQDIEDARKAGKPFDASQMDSTHQAALKALMKNPNEGANDPDKALDDEQARRARILGAAKSITK